MSSLWFSSNKSKSRLLRSMITWPLTCFNAKFGVCAGASVGPCHRCNPIIDEVHGAERIKDDVKNWCMVLRPVAYYTVRCTECVWSRFGSMPALHVLYVFAGTPHLLLLQVQYSTEGAYPDYAAPRTLAA